MKKKVKFLTTSVAIASLGVSIAATSTSLISSNITSSNSISINSSTKNDSTNNLVPSQANGQNANISTNAGPVTFNGNVITALDWYGNKLWDLDMGKQVAPNGTGNDKGKYIGPWRRAWFNWDYNRSQNTIWVLGYPNGSQKLFGINADTGKIDKTADLKNTTTSYKFITALSSGKVLVYGGATESYKATGILYDPKTESVSNLNGNSSNNLPSSDGVKDHSPATYRWYFYNLIPLASNVNLVEVVAFDAKDKGTSGDNSAKNASYNVYGILVDDNLNFIGNNQSSSTFKTAYLLAEGVENFRNTKITPKRDYFTLLNNQIVSVTYNTVILFDTSNVNDIKVTKVKMNNPNLIQTWTVDSNDNLYFKFLDDKLIYKVDGSTLKSSDDNFSPKTYLDLGSVSDSNVKNDSKNFVIYNVYGYTGQLMLIDSNYNDTIDIYNNILPTTNTSGTNWGLAIAVTTNKNQNTNGDFLGVLNGPNSIQKVSDFSIKSESLKTKIPSEITKDDLTLTNCFFKDTDPKPFIISDIDDKNGTFKVTANLYKIPWFADKLPDKAVPNVVTHEFNGSDNYNKAQEIKNKVSWKELNSSTDYDFMNMLPKNVTVDDLYALNPFQPSFQSQIIMNGNDQVYPKTIYSLGTKNDQNGTIQVNVEYQYVPMSASYTDGKETPYTFGNQTITEKQVLTYTESHTYQIFKQSDKSSFCFMGGNPNSGNSQTINVSNVPQLKNLLSAGTLPSSFLSLNSSTDKTNSSFLQFIDTTNSKGYPISKMSFNVQANDDTGTLTINATMPSNYSPDGSQHTFSVTYTGLNEKKSYEFGFTTPTQINGTSISSILPSSIDEGEIIKNFITYKGFDSNDFNVILTPDDEKGTLNVQINLNKNYADIIGNGTMFSNYIATQTFSGFMTTNQYNSRFSLTFKGDDDASLLDLKNMQVSQLYDAFGNGKKSSIQVGNQTYSSLNQLVQKLLVSSQGSSLPIDWSNENSGVTTQLYVDNSLGLASFYVNIPKDKVSGSSSDLNFIVTYSGFVKGNEVQTSDNLSFVSNTMLKNYLLSINAFKEDDLKTLTPTKFASWAKDNIDKLITYKTGEYKTKLESKSYTLTITANDLQGNVSITINFGKMTDPNSLSEYSVQYTF